VSEYRIMTRAESHYRIQRKRKFLWWVWWSWVDYYDSFRGSYFAGFATLGGAQNWIEDRRRKEYIESQPWFEAEEKENG